MKPLAADGSRIYLRIQDLARALRAALLPEETEVAQVQSLEMLRTFRKSIRRAACSPVRSGSVRIASITRFWRHGRGMASPARRRRIQREVASNCRCAGSCGGTSRSVSR